VQRLPEPLQAVADQLSRLPGLGPKSALRCAMTLLKWPESETRRLGHAIHTLRDNLTLCGRCGALADTDPCAICADPGRQAEMLCVVSEWDSLLTL
jgi:recombination protein RecR